MFRSALAAALRHLNRGKLHTAIAVLGLAVGLCAALLAALYIRSQYSYDHFVPGYRNLYLVTLNIPMLGRASYGIKETPYEVADVLRTRFPEVSSVARIAVQNVRLLAGNVDKPESIYSVDSDLPATLPFVAVAGDPVAALAVPDQVVITRALARTLFGDVPALDRTFEVELEDGSRHPVKVGAVIADTPTHRTQIQAQAFVSGATAWTRLYRRAHRATPIREMSSEVLTLVRLHPGMSRASMRAGLQQVLSQIVEMYKAQQPEQSPADDDDEYPGLNLLRIDRVNTDPDMSPGFATRIVSVAVLGFVVLAIACVNFVNLLTARAGSRALEVGVRKLAGAGRGVLALQFFGEVIVRVGIATLLSVALTELLLPHVNAFMFADAEFDYWRDPRVLGWLLLGAGVLALIGGFWPALVLSSLRPAFALRGARSVRGAGGPLRQALVTLQFAVLTGLIVAAGVVYLQRHFATRTALRFDTDQMLIVQMRCSTARLAELRKLSGIRDAACSDGQLIGDDWSSTDVKTRDGESIAVYTAWVDDRVLALFGIKPLAGRTLSPVDFELSPPRSSTRYLINESAMHRLGFESPAAALGPYPLMNGLDEIVGVLPDFSMGPVDIPIQPTVFYADPQNFSRIYVQLKGAEIPPTLDAIEKIWRNDGGTGHLDMYFYAERVQRLYQEMLREARSFGIVAVLAILLACLGLLGLATVVAEQRTREIGIRKALGANTGDVLGLLLWQFSKPVLWANLIAWPVAGWAMQRWLDGFAYHVPLPLWLFPAAGLVALVIALATVSAHALRVARAKPVTALRYE
jgi:putative ABC transport system permease protein